MIPSLTPTAVPARVTVEAWMRQFQDWLCYQLETADDGGVRFSKDAWAHPDGGGGLTRVIQQGRVLEKGGVAFSAV